MPIWVLTKVSISLKETGKFSLKKESSVVWESKCYCLRFVYRQVSKLCAHL